MHISICRVKPHKLYLGWVPVHIKRVLVSMYAIEVLNHTCVYPVSPGVQSSLVILMLYMFNKTVCLC